VQVLSSYFASTVEIQEGVKEEQIVSHTIDVVDLVFYVILFGIPLKSYGLQSCSDVRGVDLPSSSEGLQHATLKNRRDMIIKKGMLVKFTGSCVDHRYAWTYRCTLMDARRRRGREGEDCNCISGVCKGRPTWRAKRG
jgi:hypothetical protein